MPLVHCHYPVGQRHLRLAVAPHWEQLLEPVEVSPERQVWTFDVRMNGRLTAQFKPVLFRGQDMLWSQGRNCRLLKGQSRDVYPYFLPDSAGRVQVHPLEGRNIRVYTPPGYRENTLHRVPVVVMQDGQNLFEPGHFGDWLVDETLDTLHRWSHIRQFLVVGVDHQDRFAEYTEPGWRTYRDWILGALLPYLRQNFRLKEGPQNTAVMGSSLGGLVSMFLAWDQPQVFGKVACFSGAFPDFGEPFVQLVSSSSKPDLMVYLDSGMAGVQSDGFDSTRSVRDILEAKGFVNGRDLIYCCFPDHQHNEAAWASRFSLPLQFFFGG